MITEVDLSRALVPPDDSFFLFGPRGVGKSAWLKRRLSIDLTIDLLKSEEYLRFQQAPSRLRELAAALPKRSWICIDEVQKVPEILDEVHYLIETRKLRFALSGSSARKLRRGGANLLAGRAITRYLDAFSYTELRDRYALVDRLEWGCLPLIVNKPTLARDILRTYVATYIKEEIQEEGHVRKIAPFARFLQVAALFHGQQVNAASVARQASVPRANVDNYFSILTDTLLGHWLPPYRPHAKVQEQGHPKYYWFDIGVARAAAGRLDEPVESEWLGIALETLVFHELRVYFHTHQVERPIAYYRTQAGMEVDFVIETRKATLSRRPSVVLIEVKNARKWDSRWSKPMAELSASRKVVVERMIGVYRGMEILRQGDVDIFPVETFFQRLHSGDLA